MRFSPWVFLVALAALVVSSADARAQGGALDRRRRPIEETNRRLDLAETVVSTSGDAQARDELALARELQGRARSAAGAGRLRVAAQLTGLARRHADRAVMLGRGLPTQERLKAQWDRTEEMLERAGPRIRECGDDRARALLRAAVEMQERARTADEAGRCLGALQLTMGARERCLRALRLCRMEEDVQQAAELALGRTCEVLAHVREQLGTGGTGGGVFPRGRDALARATVLQDDASRQFRDAHYEASLQLTLAARRLAHRASMRGQRAH